MCLYALKRCFKARQHIQHCAITICCPKLIKRNFVNLDPLRCFSRSGSNQQLLNILHENIFQSSFSYYQPDGSLSVRMMDDFGKFLISISP